jgi:hypothetical protein
MGASFVAAEAAYGKYQNSYFFSGSTFQSLDAIDLSLLALRYARRTAEGLP